MKKTSVTDKKQEVKTMKKRNFYNKLFAKYPDVVNLKQLREMLGGFILFKLKYNELKLES